MVALGGLGKKSEGFLRWGEKKRVLINSVFLSSLINSRSVSSPETEKERGSGGEKKEREY